MHERLYRFIDPGTYDSFDELANAIEGKIQGDIIHLGPCGSIKRIVIGKGVKLVCWDIKLKQPLEVIKIAAPNRLVSLSYIFSPGEFLYKSSLSEKEVRLKNANHLIFNSGNSEVKFTVMPETEVKAIVISMERKWLEEEFSYFIPSFRELLENFIREDSSIFQCERALPADYKNAAELFHHLSAGESDIFYIKSKILLLLSHFFKGVFAQKKGETGSGHSFQYLKMKQVQGIIMDHINDDLPATASIAKEVGLSESSLKKYFRMTFDTSIYDFYLQKKMEHARSLLVEKQLPVKEVAYMLGYEKCGSFIRIFKKHFNLSPGMLQKENKRVIGF